MSKVLIHIGYPKTGSTYLQKWFAKHPDMIFRPKGIAGFTDAHDIARYAQKAEKAPAYFVLSSEDLSVWKGEYNVTGFSSRNYDINAYNHYLTNALHDIFVSPYILIVTRGYKSMLRSLYSQYVRGGGILDFAQLQVEFGKDFGVLYDYSAMVRLYQGVFGYDKVIVLPFELLESNPLQFTSLLEDKLGIENHFAFTREKINPSLTRQEMAATRRISKFIFKSLDIFPRTLQTKIYGLHIRYLAKIRNPLLVKLLARFCPVDDMTVSDDMRNIFKGKAALLKDEKLFQPYWKEYLMD